MSYNFWQVSVIIELSLLGINKHLFYSWTNCKLIFRKIIFIITWWRPVEMVGCIKNTVTARYFYFSNIGQVQCCGMQFKEVFIYFILIFWFLIIFIWRLDGFPSLLYSQPVEINKFPDPLVDNDSLCTESFVENITVWLKVRLFLIIFYV